MWNFLLTTFMIFEICDYEFFYLLQLKWKLDMIGPLLLTFRIERRKGEQQKVTMKRQKLFIFIVFHEG